MAKNYSFLKTQHGLVTDGDSYIREVAIGSKRAWLRGFVTISSCADQTDFSAHPPQVTYTFYARDSRGSTWGDLYHIHRELVSCDHWDLAGTMMCQYTAMTDFILFDLKGGSQCLHYSANGWFTRQEVQVKWILEDDEMAGVG